MSESLEKVCSAVLEQVTPSDKERGKIEALAKKLERKLLSASKSFNVKAKVRVEGSVAKDTWLSKEPDIDVFMRVPTNVPRKSLGDICLKVAREATRGSRQVERFAEHPYLEAFVDGTRVNIVPCYDVKRGKWQSATDRTPFHTDYIKKYLDKQTRGEVRLVKRFMKGIGVYGAEIKIGGFSGYLSELLVGHFGSFVDVLKSFVDQKHRVVVDIEDYYRNSDNDLRLLFNEPLVIVDPVDKSRNVASAVQPDKLCTFVAAGRAFLKDPNMRFFYSPETKALTTKALRHRFRKRGSKMVFVTFGRVNSAPDVLWGQLYKSQRSLGKLVELNDFRVLRDIAWSDERALNMFIFELEHCCIPPVKKHFGPPLEKIDECDKFLARHNNRRDTVSGPYIEGGRWVVQIRRRYSDACVLLTERLKDGGRDVGVAEGISRTLNERFKVLVNEEIAEIYQTDGKFAVFLTEFLQGRPKWLVTAQR